MARVEEPKRADPSVAPTRVQRAGGDGAGGFLAMVATLGALFLGLMVGLFSRRRRPASSGQRRIAHDAAKRAAKDPSIKPLLANSDGQIKDADDLIAKDEVRGKLQPILDQQIGDSKPDDGIDSSPLDVKPGKKPIGKKYVEQEESDEKGDDSKHAGGDAVEALSGKGGKAVSSGGADPEVDLGQEPTQVTFNGVVRIPGSLIAAFRRDLGQSTAYLQEAEGDRIARAWRVQATIFEDTGDRLIVQYGPQLGDEGKRGNLLFVNHNHYIVLEEVDADEPKFDYFCLTRNDQIRRFRRSALATPEDGSCLIHGLHLILHGSVAGKIALADARKIAAAGISDEAVRLILNTLISDVMAGQWPGGMGPFVRNYLRRDPNLMSTYYKSRQGKQSKQHKEKYKLDVAELKRRFKKLKNRYKKRSLAAEDRDVYAALQEELDAASKKIVKEDPVGLVEVAEYLDEMSALLKKAKPKRFKKGAWGGLYLDVEASSKGVEHHYDVAQRRYVDKNGKPLSEPKSLGEHRAICTQISKDLGTAIDGQSYSASGEKGLVVPSPFLSAMEEIADTLMKALGGAEKAAAAIRKDGTIVDQAIDDRDKMSKAKGKDAWAFKIKSSSEKDWSNQRARIEVMKLLNTWASRERSARMSKKEAEIRDRPKELERMIREFGQKSGWGASAGKLKSFLQQQEIPGLFKQAAKLYRRLKRDVQKDKGMLLAIAKSEASKWKKWAQERKEQGADPTFTAAKFIHPKNQRLETRSGKSGSSGRRWLDLHADLKSQLESLERMNDENGQPVGLARLMSCGEVAIIDELLQDGVFDTLEEAVHALRFMSVTSDKKHRQLCEHCRQWLTEDDGWKELPPDL